MKERKTELIQAKITPTDKKKIVESAEKLGLDLANYIRLKCLEKGGKTNG